MSALSQRFRKLSGPEDTEERGLPPRDASYNDDSKETSNMSEKDRRRLTVSKTSAEALIPDSDKLLVFRALTGIETVPIVSTAGYTPRKAANLGIYARVIKAEQEAKQSFRLYRLLLNFCLGLQIIVAALLTALGAGGGPHIAVTIFGAINTIVAGIQTYLKGSGYPGRFKYQESEWNLVREHIEQREREFCLIDCPLDVHEEIAIVEEMYKTVKLELETSSNPGSHVGSASQNRAHRNASQWTRSPSDGEPREPPPGDTVSERRSTSLNGQDGPAGA